MNLYKNCATKNIDFNKKEGVINAYVSVYNINDTDGDIIMPYAFKESIDKNLKRIKYLQDHDTTKLLGFPMDLKEDDYGLFGIFKINLSTDIGKNAFANALFFNEYGRTVEHSIRFTLEKDWYEMIENGYKILKANLLEVSLLSFYGANPLTQVTSIKAAEKLMDMPYTDEVLRDIDEKLSIIEKYIKGIKKEEENKELNIQKIINLIEK